MCLIIYYQFVVQYKFTEVTIQTYIEPIMHIFAFGISFATAIFALMHQLYNNSNYYCWIGYTSNNNADEVGEESDSTNDEKLVWVFRYVLFSLGCCA